MPKICNFFFIIINMCILGSLTCTSKQKKNTKTFPFHCSSSHKSFNNALYCVVLCVKSEFAVCDDNVTLAIIIFTSLTHFSLRPKNIHLVCESLTFFFFLSLSLFRFWSYPSLVVAKLCVFRNILFTHIII